MPLLTNDNYKEQRHLIKSGDLLAWSGRSAAGTLVRVATQSKWSHVGVAYVMGGRVWIIEAREFKGVQIVPLSSYLNCEWIPTDAEWNDQVDDYVINSIGKVDYSYTTALKAWFDATVGAYRKLDPLSQTQICSSFAPIVLRMAGVFLPNVLMTPGYLVNRFIVQGEANV